MQSQFQEHRQTAVEADQVLKNVEALRRWLAANHPGAVGIAFENLFTDYFGDALTTELNDDDFVFAYEHLKGSMRPKRVPTPEEQKADLIDEITDLLRSEDGTGRGGKYSNFNLTAVRQQMQHWDLGKLTARRDEIVRAQTLNQQPVKELKAIVKEAYRDQRRFPGYPDLPATIVPRGGVQAVNCDSAFLINLARADYSEYRHLCAKFGAEQITARQKGII